MPGSSVATKLTESLNCENQEKLMFPSIFCKFFHFIYSIISDQIIAKRMAIMFLDKRFYDPKQAFDQLKRLGEIGDLTMFPCVHLYFTGYLSWTLNCNLEQFGKKKQKQQYVIFITKFKFQNHIKISSSGGAESKYLYWSNSIDYYVNCSLRCGRAIIWYRFRSLTNIFMKNPTWPAFKILLFFFRRKTHCWVRGLFRAEIARYPQCRPIEVDTLTLPYWSSIKFIALLKAIQLKTSQKNHSNIYTFSPRNI